MTEPCCDARYDEQFDAQKAQRELAAYRKRGPSAATRRLAAVLAADGAAGLTVLDVGAGMGGLHHLLLEAGAASAVDVDASRPYLEAARSEAERRGLGDRVRFEFGDLTLIGGRIEPADLVALDRVVCCHPDVAALVGAAASRTQRRLALVLPHDRAWIRVAIAVANLVERLRGRTFRAFVHPVAAVDTAATGAGLGRTERRSLGLFWQLLAYERPAAHGAPSQPGG